jgi:hypothetical protein
MASRAAIPLRSRQGFCWNESNRSLRIKSLEKQGKMSEAGWSEENLRRPGATLDAQLKVEDL